MKRVIALIIVLFFAVAGYAYADVYMTKKAGDFMVTAAFDKQPPALGKNDLSINIKDAGGKPITDANVKIKYYMTAQRQSTQMPYMEQSGRAVLSGSVYKSTLDLPMKGPWYLVIKILRGGQEESVTFHFHVE